MADEFEPLWQMAFEEAKKQFEIENFLAEQKEAIKAFFQNKNVFVNLPTGFGKSIIYQCPTIVGDVLDKIPRGSSVWWPRTAIDIFANNFFNACKNYYFYKHFNFFVAFFSFILKNF